MSPSNETAGSRPARLALIVLMVAYWLIGFYPFRTSLLRLSHDNHVEVTSSGTLRFEQPGIALTDAPPSWLSDARANGRLDVDLVVRPFDVDQRSAARIFTLSIDSALRNMTLGQSRDALVVCVRTSETDEDGDPGHLIDEVFEPGTPRHIVVRIRPTAWEVWIDDERRIRERLPPDGLSLWNPRYRLAFGSEVDFERHWRGEIVRAVTRVGAEEVVHVPLDASADRAPRLSLPSPYRVPLESLRAELIPFGSYVSIGVPRFRDWTLNCSASSRSAFCSAPRRRVNRGACSTWNMRSHEVSRKGVNAPWNIIPTVTPEPALEGASRNGVTCVRLRRAKAELVEDAIELIE